MTVNELCARLNFKAVCIPDGDREIDGVYVGDLLSWVMGRAEENMAWITIMSNSNTVAVATLVGLSVIILAEGVTPDSDTETIAMEKGVNVLISPLSAYETAIKLSEVLI